MGIAAPGVVGAAGGEHARAAPAILRCGCTAPFVELALVALARLVSGPMLRRGVARVFRRVIDVLAKQLLAHRRVIHGVQNVLVPELVHVLTPRHHHLTRVPREQPEELAVLSVCRRDPRVLPVLAAPQLLMNFGEVQRTDVLPRDSRPILVGRTRDNQNHDNNQETNNQK